jgi:hypothetical protein
MSPDEIMAINEAKSETEKRTWEQVRTICYWSVVAMNGTEKFPNPEDLFKFPWEKKNGK